MHLEKTAVVSNLLKLGIDPNFNNSHYQAEYHTNKDLTIDKTFTPLQIAAIKGNFQISPLLLESGAKVDAVSCSVPFRPLEFAISLNHGNFTIFELMITSGADIVCSCEDEVTIGRRLVARSLTRQRTKRTLLMKAVEAQNVDIARFLLSKGAPVNDVSDISGTALHIAIENDDLDMINLLLQEGAGVNIVDALEISARRYFECQLEQLTLPPQTKMKARRKFSLVCMTSSTTWSSGASSCRSKWPRRGTMFAWFGVFWRREQQSIIFPTGTKFGNPFHHPLLGQGDGNIISI